LNGAVTWLMWDADGGRGLIKLAQAFPRSCYVEYDNFGPTVARATENAREAGVSDRVRFEERDVSKGLPAEFDVITTFDVVHDAVDPPGAAARWDLCVSRHHLLGSARRERESARRD